MTTRVTRFQFDSIDEEAILTVSRSPRIHGNEFPKIEDVPADVRASLGQWLDQHPDKAGKAGAA